MKLVARCEEGGKVRTSTQERGYERLLYGIGADTRESKDERGTKDHLGKDCRKRKRLSRVEELECGQGGGTRRGGGGWADDVTALCASWRNER